MKNRLIMFLISPLLLVLAGCPGPYDEPREIQAKDANMLIAASYQSGEQPFARFYKLDLSVLERMGDDASSLYILHGLADNNRKVIIIGPVDDNAEVMPEGPYFIQTDETLCPPTCDGPMSAALEVTEGEARQYIDKYRSSAMDEVKAFLVPRSVIRRLRAINGVSALLVARALNDDRACLIVRGANSAGEQLLTPVYLQNETTLCPPTCDLDVVEAAAQ